MGQEYKDLFWFPSRSAQHQYHFSRQNYSNVIIIGTVQPSRLLTGSTSASARAQHDHVNSLKRHHQKKQLDGHVKLDLSSYCLSISLSVSSFSSPLLICLYRCPASGAHVMSTWTFHLIHNCIRFCKHILFVAWSGQHCWKISNEMQPPT